MSPDTEEFMNKMVSSYDNIHTHRYWEEIAQFFHNEDLKIMDLGCGPGLLLEDFIKKFDVKQIYGIDLSEIMLEKAAKILGPYSKNVSIDLIRQHLQQETDLPTGLDIIVSSRVMRSFENHQDLLSSIHNSLNNDGRLIIADWTRASLEDYYHYLSRDDKHFEDLTLDKLIAYHRNFSRFDIDDWNFILSRSQFEVLHSFAINEIYDCIIAKTIQK